MGQIAYFAWNGLLLAAVTLVWAEVPYHVTAVFVHGIDRVGAAVTWRSDPLITLIFIADIFVNLRTPVLEVKGFEADDVLATIVDKALGLPEIEIVVVTGDKDLLQLVGPRVRVLSVAGRTGEPVLYDEAKVRERWGVEPGQIADVLALMGDAIDNIKGVRGVGEKTAVKLIE